jgi:hypothetical protein
MFRDHTPGFVPWYLENAQVRFLTIALQQAIEVSTRFKKDESLLEHPSRAHYFVRVPESKVYGRMSGWFLASRKGSYPGDAC